MRKAKTYIIHPWQIISTKYKLRALAERLVLLKYTPGENGKNCGKVSALYYNYAMNPYMLKSAAGVVFQKHFRSNCPQPAKPIFVDRGIHFKNTKK